MAPPHDITAKDLNYGHLWNWGDVSAPFCSTISFFYNVPYTKSCLIPKIRMILLIEIDSICVISAVRIAFLWNINENDLTWSNEPSGLWTFLEPALSIINTCLPVLQPVANKMSRILGVKQNTTSSNSWNESFGGGKSNAMRHGTDGGRNFERLDDLADPSIESTGNYSVITGPASKEIPDPYDLGEPESISDRAASSTGIKVKKDWEVKTATGTPSKSLFGNVPKDWEHEPGAGMPVPLPHGL